MRRPRLPFMTVLTSIFLFLTLLGYFVSHDALLGIQWILVNWAVIIGAFAVVLGFVNVLSVHIGKLTSRASGWLYSLVLIISAVIVLIVGLGGGLWEPVMTPIFIWVIAPLEAATAALLPFILTYAAYRMLRRGRPEGTFVFLISALIVLVSRIPLSGLGAGLGDLRDVWLSWLAIPGLRAVLIGVALGIAMTAWRLVLGIDRPQG